MLSPGKFKAMEPATEIVYPLTLPAPVGKATLPVFTLWLSP